MLRIRRTCPMSWFHPEGARVLGARLSERLWRRMSGGGLFLTLSYDRSGYSEARELYEEASRDRHVRRFIHRLEKYLGASLRGKWFRKMEFHKDGEGWLHWHLLIDWRSRIPHEALERLWGHGFVWVNKATKRRVQYCAKYVAKTLDDLPGWLLGERARSVKIVACSPGFWGKSDEKIARSESRACAWKVPAYVTVGEAMERNRDMVEVQDLSQFAGELFSENYRFALSMFDVAQVLDHYGCSLHDDGDGWFSCGCGDRDVNGIIADFEGVAWAKAGGAGSRESGDGPPFHLTNTRDAPRAWLVKVLESTGGLNWVSRESQILQEAA